MKQEPLSRLCWNGRGMRLPIFRRRQMPSSGGADLVVAQTQRLAQPASSREQDNKERRQFLRHHIEAREEKANFARGQHALAALCMKVRDACRRVMAGVESSPNSPGEAGLEYRQSLIGLLWSGVHRQMPGFNLRKRRHGCPMREMLCHDARHVAIGRLMCA